MTEAERELDLQLGDAREEINNLRRQLADAVARADALQAAMQPPDRHELQLAGKHPSPCAKFCEATAFLIQERGLRRQLDHANQRIAELEAAYMEQVDLTIRIRDTGCAECAQRQATRDRFDAESA